MIISKQCDASNNAFETLLTNGLNIIQSEADKEPRRYCELSSLDFEKVVYVAYQNGEEAFKRKVTELFK